MRIHQHKRQSTTMRLTKRIMALIGFATQTGQGVIVRDGGEEIGVWCVDSNWIHTIEGSYPTARARNLTIRRTTVDALEREFGFLTAWAA